jgi:hypothetical protein
MGDPEENRIAPEVQKNGQVHRGEVQALPP